MLETVNNCFYKYMFVYPFPSRHFWHDLTLNCCNILNLFKLLKSVIGNRQLQIETILHLLKFKFSLNM